MTSKSSPQLPCCFTDEPSEEKIEQYLRSTNLRHYHSVLPPSYLLSMYNKCDVSGLRSFYKSLYNALQPMISQLHQFRLIKFYFKELKYNIDIRRAYFEKTASIQKQDEKHDKYVMKFLSSLMYVAMDNMLMDFVIMKISRMSLEDPRSVCQKEYERRDNEYRKTAQPAIDFFLSDTKVSEIVEKIQDPDDRILFTTSNHWLCDEYPQLSQFFTEVEPTQTAQLRHHAPVSHDTVTVGDIQVAAPDFVNNQKDDDERSLFILAPYGVGKTSIGVKNRQVCSFECEHYPDSKGLSVLPKIMTSSNYFKYKHERHLIISYPPAEQLKRSIIKQLGRAESMQDAVSRLRNLKKMFTHMYIKNKERIIWIDPSETMGSVVDTLLIVCNIRRAPLVDVWTL